MEKDPFKEYLRESEPDKVSSRIAEILSETAQYISIHRKLFQGIYKYAGKIRDYNITKKEWVLDGATVIYGSASELRATLEYDFLQEQAWSVRTLQRNISSQYYYRMLMSQNSEPVEKEMKKLTASYQADKLEVIKIQ